MTDSEPSTTPALVEKRPWLEQVAPVLLLLLLAPLIVDMLPGTTRVTMPLGLLAEIATYGCAALLIRWVVCYRHLSRLSIILLGIAYALAEECIFLQTSLTPTIGPGHIYARIAGVNWVYLLWALGYEAVWSILIPIQLAELTFPARRREAWFGLRGLSVIGLIFVFGTIYAWYFWNQVVVVRFYHGQVYQPPLLALIVALGVVIGLVVLALSLKQVPFARPTGKRSVPRPWLLGLLAFVMSLLWYVLLFINAGLMPGLPVAVPLLSGLLMAGISFLLIWYWSASSAWQDTHRLALISGALLACMLEGFIMFGNAQPIDLIGKIVLNVAALIGLFWLRRRLTASSIPAKQA
ncbi:hypothetical protein EPA93_07535 [Ktedonosporobacter rubrisoli]|uniref:Uncharacterized protein n=1 Tax=Ktedonosporobacter rubrisoli TaxID=2509675 RepID=A0A4P6JKY1_KTERU|nr:hypothetical protein [Ktedonosporobacter rubrisoli]QBD75867.1 hypothetical protein EPA93_07535 [Ktedonosporobacter rubrisoli]